MKDKVYLLQKIKNNPEKAAELANLIYVSDKDLTIKRCRAGKGFIIILIRTKKLTIENR
jgi:predicted nuclease of predicted toxin-antitoxin system